jgi:hypothetical protein
MNMPPPPPPPVAAPVVVKPTPLVEIPSAEFAACKGENEQKQFLGNYLYQFAVRFAQSNGYSQDDQEGLSGKVTGMILDGQTVEYILYLCSDRNAFNQIVKDSIKLIKNSPEVATKTEKGAQDVQQLPN